MYKNIIQNLKHKINTNKKKLKFSNVCKWVYSYVFWRNMYFAGILSHHMTVSVVKINNNNENYEIMLVQCKSVHPS